MPGELQIRSKRLKKIAQAKAEIERRAKERYAEERMQYEEKLAVRAKKQQIVVFAPRRGLQS